MLLLRLKIQQKRFALRLSEANRGKQTEDVTEIAQEQDESVKVFTELTVFVFLKIRAVASSLDYAILKKNNKILSSWPAVKKYRV